MRKIQLTMLLLTTTAMLVGCSVDSSQGEGAPIDPITPLNPAASLETAIEQAVDNAIVASVDDFALRTVSLDSAVDNFCASPDEAGLVQIQENWRDTFSQWYRLSLYNFGPLQDDIVFPPYTFIDSLRLRGTDYIQTVRDEIASDISSNAALTDSYFAGKTFQRVGLLALESAAFETSTAENSALLDDIVSEYRSEPRKCLVLQGLAGQLQQRASNVEQGWTVAYRGSGAAYRTLFLAGQLEDGTEPLSQILISAQEFLDYLQARRVAVTAGQLAMHSWMAISATIDEVEELLGGGATSTDTLFSVMRATGNQNAVATVENNIAQVRQSIADRDVEMLEITLGFLDGNFKREIPDSLNVDLGINFSDGD